MVKYGLDHAEAQASIRIRQPEDERELLYSLKLIDTDANIKLWLARVLVMRWEQRARRVQQSNDRVCQDPLSAESVLIVTGLVIVKKTVVRRTQENVTSP
jgi:hypothetical protein